MWVVHEKAWVRIIFEMLAGVVSVKFRKKVVHCTYSFPPQSLSIPPIDSTNQFSFTPVNTLSDLALHLDITNLCIPPAVYFHDRKLNLSIAIPSPPPPVFFRPPFHTPANPPRVGENMPLPKVLVDTYRYIRSSCLSVEGLFRVPPHAILLDILREAVDREQTIKWDEWGPYTAAALVKLYYRSLPEPIFPCEYYGRLTSLTNEMEEKGEDGTFSAVRTLLESEEKGLPKSSRVLLLKHLLPLLALVAQNSDVNKMTPLNLAVCIAGSLVRSDDMVADAKASSGVRKFLEVAIERIEELAPELPNRNSCGGSYRSDMEQLGVGIDTPTPPTSPPSYNAGKQIQRKTVPGTTPSAGADVVPRKRIPVSGSSVDAQKPVDVEASRAPAVPQPAILAPPPVAHRKGSVSSLSTAVSASTAQSTAPSTTPAAKMPGPDEGRGGIVLRRKASLQALVGGDLGTLSKGPSSSLSPHPSLSHMTRSLSVSSPMPPRVVRRAISSSYLPSSPSLFSPSPPSVSSSSSVAAIANSLSRAQFNPSLNPNNPNNPNNSNNSPVPTASPMVRARTESIVGNRSRAGTGASMIERAMPAVGSGVVEELRALYEERAKGVEVLVRGGVMGSVKGRWKEQ